LKAAINELEQASHAVSKVLYESAQAAAPGDASAADAGDASSGSSEGDDAIDAEFEVKDN
jgi:molecular chaperone DnaK